MADTRMLLLRTRKFIKEMEIISYFLEFSILLKHMLTCMVVFSLYAALNYDDAMRGIKWTITLITTINVYA